MEREKEQMETRGKGPAEQECRGLSSGPTLSYLWPWRVILFDVLVEEGRELGHEI